MSSLEQTIQALLADGPYTESGLWGKLLTSGFRPAEIEAALQTMRPPDLQGPADGNNLLDTALSRQERLLENLFLSSNGKHHPSTTNSTGTQARRASMETAELVVFTDDIQLEEELDRALSPLGIGTVRKAPIAQITSEKQVEEFLASAKRSTPDLSIVGTTQGLRETADLINRVAVRLRCPALYYNLHAMQVQIGPLVIPEVTACLECFKIRRNSNLLPWERMFDGYTQDQGRLATSLGTDWIVVDVIKVLTHLGEPVSRGRLMFVDYLSGIPELHPILKLPRCPVCGPPRKPQVRLWEGL